MISIISQSIVIEDNKVLMVKQYVERGDIVWNFPGGGIHEQETPEEACIRETKEETGFDIEIIELIDRNEKHEKYTFIARIKGGSMFLDKAIKDNEDIIEIDWVPLDDESRFDEITRPIIRRVKEIWF